MHKSRYCIAVALVVWGLAATPSPARQPAPQQRPASHDAAAGEDQRDLRPAGALQGNWRIVRDGDRADAAVMRVQIVHDGVRLEGSYVLFQPFCSIDQPLPVAGTDDCEFIDQGGEIIAGQVRGRWARITLRPGADGLDHWITFRARPASGPLSGRYHAPGDRTGVPVTLERAPE